MKTKKMKFFMLCLIFASFSFVTSAQTHLDALIKKCETLKSVDMEVVKNKRKTDEDIEIRTVNIRITDDKKLVNEFIDAFKKDSPNAEQAMFRKRRESAEINYYQAQFSKQTYTIVVKETGDANITVGNNLRFQTRKSSTDSLRLNNRQKQDQERMKKLQKQNQERIKKDQEKIKRIQKQNQERMKRNQERLKQNLENIKQYKLNDLDSTLLKNNTIVDSLVIKSSPSQFH